MSHKVSVFVRGGMILALALVLLTSAVAPVHAAEFPPSGTIPADQTVEDDVFVSGQDVSVDGTVNGMLFGTGNRVVLNGTVNGDALLMGAYVVVGENAVINGNLFFAGQALEVKGKVTGSVFGGSSSLVVAEKAQIARNLYYGGYSLEQKAGSQIEKDLFMGGYQATLAGKVGRDVRASCGAMDLSGMVGRDAKLDVASPEDRGNYSFNPSQFMQQQPGVPPMPAQLPAGLRIASSAVVMGKVIYTSSVDQQSAIKAAPMGGVVYQTPVPTESTQEAKPVKVETRYPALGWLFRWLRSLVTLLVLGGLALWLMPKLFNAVVTQAESKPLPAAGYGFLAVLVGYAGAFLAFMVLIAVVVIVSLLTLTGLSGTVFGIGASALALIFAVFVLLVTFMSKVVVAYLIGDLFMRKASPQTSHRSIWALGIGVFVYTLVRTIPVLGWLIGIAATLVGLGAMWLAYRASRVPAQAAV